MRNMVVGAFKKYTKEMIIIIVLSVISSLTKGVSVVMLIPMLNIMNISGTDIGPLSFAVTLFSSMSYTLRIIILLGVYVFIILLTSLLSRFMSIFNTKFVQKYIKHLRLRVYDSVIDANWEVLTAQKNDDLLNSFTSEINKISRAITIFPALISIVLTAATQLTIAFALNVPLTIVVIIVGGFFFFAFKNFFKLAKKNGERIRLANKQYLGEIRGQLDSIKEIKSYGVEDFHKEILHGVLNEYEEANVENTKMSTIPSLLFSMSSTVLIAIIFYVANVVIKVEVIELVLIVYIFARIWPIFSTLHRQILTLNNSLPSFENIETTMNILGSMPKEQETKDGYIYLNKAINFRNITFSYASSDEVILQNTSFVINANSITALKGKSGVGKSTIVNLLMGLLKPNTGTIQIDDIELNNENIKTWRKSIGYMPQDPIILNKTIKENIIRFNPNATDKEILLALEKAQALDFIKKLPNGLDTFMGNKGTRLSGGEKQRIVLARALVRNPSILILDEATSALDNENEKSIQETLQSLKKSVTIVVIAHRQSTINAADYVINVEDGGAISITDK